MNAPPIQYAKTSDGYNIAYAVSGSGTPLVFIPANLVDIQAAWELYPAWMRGLHERFQLIQYDCRGRGFSTRNLPENVSFLDFDRDLEAVADRLKLDRFLIWGWGSRGHSAIRYASAHPDKVIGLILVLCSVTIFTAAVPCSRASPRTTGRACSSSWRAVASRQMSTRSVSPFCGAA
jgi:pimeloyl-ACP methyl ester carboxylesterase